MRRCSIVKYTKHFPNIKKPNKKNVCRGPPLPKYSYIQFFVHSKRGQMKISQIVQNVHTYI